MKNLGFSSTECSNEFPLSGDAAKKEIPFFVQSLTKKTEIEEPIPIPIPVPVNLEVTEADIESENIGFESSKLEGELEEAGKGKKGIRKIKIALGLRKKPATEANTVF